MHGKDLSPQTPSDTYPGARTDDGGSTVQATAGGQPVKARRARGLFGSTPVRLALATGLIGGLGLVAVAETRADIAQPDQPAGLGESLTDRAVAAQNEAASRSLARTPSPTVSPTPSPTATPKKPARKKPARPAHPKPVAGLTQAQMNNAKVIADVGRGMHVPRRGLVVAISTAMQESDLYNLASDVLPESLDLPHEGSGADHDSVGLFQQRPSSGWGEVADLMRPSYAARQFYAALLEVPGWQDMSVAEAAQAVQISAFPDAYAQHEDRATTVVTALLA